MRLSRSAVLVAQLIIFSAGSSPLRAVQQPGAAQDSASSDSVRGREGDCWLLLPVIAGLSAVLAVAPPALLLPRNLTQYDTSWSQPERYVTAYLTGGGMGADSPFEGWSHSENVELLSDHLYAAMRMETFNVSRRVRFQSVSAGYLFRPKPAVRAGLTLGYRHVSEGGAPDGAQVGLPLMVGTRAHLVRFEPTYVISREGVMWRYRIQGEFVLPRTPLVAGLAFEATPLRQGGSYQGLVTLLFGIRK